jgi:hypothetical protein
MELAWSRTFLPPSLNSYILVPAPPLKLQLFPLLKEKKREGRKIREYDTSSPFVLDLFHCHRILLNFDDISASQPASHPVCLLACFTRDYLPCNHQQKPLTTSGLPAIIDTRLRMNCYAATPHLLDGTKSTTPQPQCSPKVPRPASLTPTR